MGFINYRASASRLAAEVDDTGLFSTSVAWDENDLRRMSPQFWNDHQDVLKARTPGFGWWVWKPYFLMHSLLSIPEGEGLLYLDAGCIINSDVDSVKTISDFMKLTEAQKVSGSNSDYFSEDLYTCNDLLDYMQISSSQRTTSQFCAAILFVVNDYEGREFIEEWCKMVCMDDHRWLLPNRFETENPPNFIHHMYDQATLSCLLKSKSKISVHTGNKTTPGAIRLARHRFAYSIDEKSFPKITYYKFLQKLSRISLAVQHRVYRSSLTIRPQSHKLNIPKKIKSDDVQF